MRDMSSITSASAPVLLLYCATRCAWAALSRASSRQLLMPRSTLERRADNIPVALANFSDWRVAEAATSISDECVPCWQWNNVDKTWRWQAPIPQCILDWA